MNDTEIRANKAANYGAKWAAGFTCETEGCEHRDQLLVVKSADGGREVSCQRHLGARKTWPCQWDEAAARREQERKDRRK